MFEFVNGKFETNFHIHFSEEESPQEDIEKPDEDDKWRKIGNGSD